MTDSADRLFWNYVVLLSKHASLYANEQVVALTVCEETKRGARDWNDDRTGGADWVRTASYFPGPGPSRASNSLEGRRLTRDRKALCLEREREEKETSDQLGSLFGH